MLKNWPPIGTAARTATVEITALSAAQTAAATSGAVAGASAGRLAALLGSIKVFALVAVLANLKEIGTAIGEGVAKWAGYGKAIEAAEAAAKAEEAATRANAAAKAELAQKTQMASDKALGLTDISRKVVAEFDDLTKKGSSAAEALEKVGKSLDLKDLSGITNAGAALDALAVKGKISATEVQNAFASALKGVDLVTFATNARAAFDGSEQGARRLKVALDAVATESLTRAGTSVKELQTGFNTAMVSAINDVDTLAKTLTGLGLKGETAGRVLTVSLNRALELATTEAAVKAVIERLEDLGKRGVLTGEQLAAGLTKAREKLDQILPGVNTVAEAMKNLGVVSDKTLADTAKHAKESYDSMVAAGSSSARELSEAFRKSADAAIAANNGIAPSWVQAQAGARGYEIQVDSAGKSTIKAANEGRQAIAAMGDQWRLTAEEVKANEEAMDLLAMKYKLSADYTEAEIALLDRLTAASERATAAENKRLNRDSQGFSIDPTTGKRVEMQIDSQRSVYENAKSQGLTEQQSLAIMTRFMSENGQKLGWNDGGRIGAMQGENWGTALQKAINEQVLSNATNAANSGTAATPGAAPPAPNNFQPPATVSTVNINIGGRSTSVNVASREDARALTSVLRQLETAKGTSA